MACLHAAVGTDISGLVTLSSVMNLPGLQKVTTRDIENLTIPKIVMFSENDAWFPEEVPLYHELAENLGQPKSVYSYPGMSHATGLFYDENGVEVLQILLDFLKDQLQ